MEVGELPWEQPMVVFHYGKIGFIGTGKMAEALVSALVRNDYSDIIASRRTKSELDRLTSEYGIQTTTDNKEVAANADVIIFGVEPQGLEEVLKEVREYSANDKLWISIAAGKSLELLKGYLGVDSRIVRCMPNMGSLIGHGGTGYTMSESYTQKDKAIVEYIFSLEGVCVEVRNDCMDAITAIACLPGLLGQQVRQYKETLTKFGLDPKISHALIANIFLTVGTLMQNDGGDDIYRKVASKGGATEAAEIFARTHGLYELLAGLLVASIERCRELGKKG